MSKVLMALQSVLLVRILSKSEFGLYSYAFNIVSLLILFNGAGAVNAVLQLCSESLRDRAKMLAFYAYGKRSGVGFDLMLALVVVAVGLWGGLALPQAGPMIAAFALYPLLTLIYELRLTWLRVMRSNREYSINTATRTILFVGFSLAGAYVMGAWGVILGHYVALLTANLLLHIGRRETPTRSTVQLTSPEKRGYWSVALVSSLNTGLSSALTLLGTFIVGALMIDADAVANYKVATTVPFALMFIPGAVGTYIYPYFASRRWDRAWTVRRYLQLTVLSLVAYGSLSLALVVGAKPVIIALFSEDYLASVLPFQVMLIGFFVNSALRAPTGGLLVTQRRLAYNTFVGVVSIVASVVLNVALIPLWGTTGAAAAYSCTMAIGAVLTVPYYVYRIVTLPSKQPVHDDAANVAKDS